METRGDGYEVCRMRENPQIAGTQRRRKRPTSEEIAQTLHTALRGYRPASCTRDGVCCALEASIYPLLAKKHAKRMRPQADFDALKSYVTGLADGYNLILGDSEIHLTNC